MGQTAYFKTKGLGHRAYIKLEWCELTVREPEATEVQPEDPFAITAYVTDTIKRGEELWNRPSAP